MCALIFSFWFKGSIMYTSLFLSLYSVSGDLSVSEYRAAAKCISVRQISRSVTAGVQRERMTDLSCQEACCWLCWVPHKLMRAGLQGDNNHWVFGAENATLIHLFQKCPFVYMFGEESADEDQFHIDFGTIDPEPFLLSIVHKNISSQPTWWLGEFPSEYSNLERIRKAIHSFTLLFIL